MIKTIQMINALFHQQERLVTTSLQQQIIQYFPHIKFTTSKKTVDAAIREMKVSNHNLLFLEVEENLNQYSQLFKFQEDNTSETVLITSRKDFVIKTMNNKISAYLLKPTKDEVLKRTIEKVIDRILKKLNSSKYCAPHYGEEVIGIPTMEGYEFLTIKDIIRCESYLKCTRVITESRKVIISSYNIGQFIKVLEQYGFYAPHQSHMINLNKIKTYLKEGTLITKDNAIIPVARRRKQEFLSRIPHL